MPNTPEVFTDFYFNGHNASEYNLVRVSDGSRYNDNLLPTLTDKTTEVPGGDGMYLFNTYYKQRQFSINVAFDSVTETDLRNIRNWLDGKGVHSLIFNERPNRQYQAKVTGTPSFKYIAFDQPTTESLSSNAEGASITPGTATTEVIYKGEGTIQFTCYDPFAYDSDITSVSSSGENTATVGGTAPTPFTVSISGASLPAGTRISVNGSSYFITLTQQATAINWSGATGLVTNGSSPIPYTGNGTGLLSVGAVVKPIITIPTGQTGSGTATLSFRNRYI